MGGPQAVGPIRFVTCPGEHVQVLASTCRQQQQFTSFHVTVCYVFMGNKVLLQQWWSTCMLQFSSAALAHSSAALAEQPQLRQAEYHKACSHQSASRVRNH